MRTGTPPGRDCFLRHRGGAALLCKQVTLQAEWLHARHAASWRFPTWWQNVRLSEKARGQAVGSLDTWS